MTAIEPQYSPRHEVRARPLRRLGRRPAVGLDGMGITELAEQLGTTHRALRYYEQVQLIRPDRNAQGARSYGPDTRRALELIVILRRTGHPLREIKAILSGDGAGDEAVRLKVAAALQTRLDVLQDQVSQTETLLAHFCAPRGQSKEKSPWPPT